MRLNGFWLYRIKPCLGLPMRSRTLLAVLLTFAPGNAMALSWTCPRCGQTFRFDSRDKAYLSNFSSNHLAAHGSESVVTTPSPQTPAAPPDPLTGLRDRYSQIHARLLQAFGEYAADLTAYRHVPTLHGLGAEIAAIQAHVDGVISRFDEDRARLVQDAAALRAALGNERAEQDAMSRQVEELKAAARVWEKECAEASARNKAARERIAELAERAKTVRGEAHSTRDAVFGHLEAARKAGLIGPPSAFVNPPSLPQAEIRSETWKHDPLAGPVAASVPAPSVQAVRLLPAAVAAAAPRVAVKATHDSAGVEAALTRLDKTPELLAAARRAHAGAREDLQRKRGDLAGSRGISAQLRETRASVENLKEKVESQAAGLRTEALDLRDREHAGKHDLLREIAAWAYWRAFDTWLKPQVEAVTGGNRLRAEALVKWGAVMRDVIQLNEDVAGFLPRAVNDCVYLRAAAEPHFTKANERFATRALMDATGTPTPWAWPFLRAEDKP